MNKDKIEKIAHKIVVAADASDVFSMETSTKEVDKACKLMNEAIMVLRKWEAAAAGNEKAKKKLEEFQV